MRTRSVLLGTTRILIYLWGAILPVVVVALFFGLDQWSWLLANLSFMKIHPRYSGGEISIKVEEPGVKYVSHDPVFDGLIGVRQNGFVQIDIHVSDDGVYPLKKEFDYDQNGVSDFALLIESPVNKMPRLISDSPVVGGLAGWAMTSEGWVVRIAIKNPNF